MSSTRLLTEQNLNWTIVEGGIARTSSIRRVRFMPGEKIKIVEWSGEGNEQEEEDHNREGEQGKQVITEDEAFEEHYIEETEKGNKSQMKNILNEDGLEGDDEQPEEKVKRETNSHRKGMANTAALRNGLDRNFVVTHRKQVKLELYFFPFFSQ